MSKRPRCFRCGKGLSQKHRIGPEERLLLAIFNKPSMSCTDCAKIMDKEIEESRKNA